MNNFFEMFKLAKESGEIEDELALYNAINASSDKFGKARFDAGYELGHRHGSTGKVKPLYADSEVSEAILKKAISEVFAAIGMRASG